MAKVCCLRNFNCKECIRLLVKKLFMIWLVFKVFAVMKRKRYQISLNCILRYTHDLYVKSGFNISKCSLNSFALIFLQNCAKVAGEIHSLFDQLCLTNTE